MPNADKPWRPFVVLVASDTEIGGRALHSVLEPCGYAALSVASGREALHQATSAMPDAVLIDARLPDMTGLEVCQQLSGDPDFDPATPIMLMTARGNSRAERLEAYTAGVWDVCSQPLDGAALLLKLQIFLRAKQAAGRARERTLFDGATGLYNLRGLELRITELAAQAARRREPLACIAFAIRREGDEESDDGLYAAGPATVREAGRAFRTYLRGSDLIGRVDRNELMVVASSTDAAGAVRLIDRLGNAMAEEVAPGGSPSALVLCAGYCATQNVAESKLGPVAMLQRATAALHERVAGPGRTVVDLDSRVRGEEAQP